MVKKEKKILFILKDGSIITEEIKKNELQNSEKKISNLLPYLQPIPKFDWKFLVISVILINIIII